MKKEQIPVPVAPWCQNCPEFQALTKEAPKHGYSLNDVAALVIGVCQGAPEPRPTVHPDGTPLEYWETTLPRCIAGKVLLEIEAQNGAKRLGFKLS